MSVRLEGKVAAITGAGRGIGRAAAELFAREGAKVAILEIDPSLGREAEAKIRKDGGVAHFFELDIGDVVSVEGTFSQVERSFGGLHILYNNASVFLGKEDAPVSELTRETWEKITRINLDGLYYCSKCALPSIVRSGGGSIINTSSSAGLIGIPGCDAYTASKGATISLTRSMAVEYGRKNVRVNCIAPAGVLTPMVRESNLDKPGFDVEIIKRVTPLGRWGTAEEIAKVALFLASDDSSYVNGAVIVVDGGITITNCY